MKMLRVLVVVFFVVCLIGNRPPVKVSRAENIPLSLADSLRPATTSTMSVQGALLATRYMTLDALKQDVDIEYFLVLDNANTSLKKRPLVRITHRSHDKEVTSLLESNISEYHFIQARDGSFWDKMGLAIKAPIVVKHKDDLQRVYYLARRIRATFGVEDVAFYDFAETMVCNISSGDVAVVPAKHFTEKGFINTFNHITGQAFMTSLFSEQLADFIADAHELYRLPELATGKFTQAQLEDLENGPIDNYVDLVNNEWGQELGKQLKEKYQIDSDTHWTPTLLANYLNDIQRYYSWAFQISFRPYRATDEVVITFAHKLNRVLKELDGVG